MTKKTNLPVLVEINKEVTKQLASREVMNALVATTFNNFSELMVKQAVTEGMMRGFEFTDFLQKNVYAIKYGSGYSLVTSIDYSRKVGMRSGVVGKTAPTYEFSEDGKKVVSCTVTVQKKDKDGYVGDFTEKVYFDEYTTGKNQWLTKPRTMIAKVAEMHALRQACPEELAKAYVEEEFQKEGSVIEEGISDEVKKQVSDSKTEDELKKVWEENKGLGKEFAKMVVEQKKFIQQVVKDENGKK